MIKRDTYIVPLKRLSEIVSITFCVWIGKIDRSRANTVLSAEITETLQFADVLNQRINHLLEAHDKVMSLYIDDLFKDSFLHLQFFQFETLTHDLLNAIHDLELSLIPALHPADWQKFSQHESEIEALINLIRDLLKDGSEKPGVTALTPLTKRQIQICRQLYTMESERVVLDWFLSEGCKGNPGRLIEHYSKSNSLEKTIELF